MVFIIISRTVMALTVNRYWYSSFASNCYPDQSPKSRAIEAGIPDALKQSAPKSPAGAVLKGLVFEPHPIPKPFRKTKDLLVVASPRQLPSVPEQFQQYSPPSGGTTNLVGQAEGPQVILLRSDA
jgi:hypothetical protein